MFESMTLKKANRSKRKETKELVVPELNPMYNDTEPNSMFHMITPSTNYLGI